MVVKDVTCNNRKLTRKQRAEHFLLSVLSRKCIKKNHFFLSAIIFLFEVELFSLTITLKTKYNQYFNHLFTNQS